MNTVCIFIGGGIGSVLRYSTSLLFVSTKIPYGTLIVNVAASFILGFLFSVFNTKQDISSSVRFLVTTGFCGGLSTFSTFAFESLDLFKTFGLKYALSYSILSVVLCVLMVACGFELEKYLNL